MSLEDLEFAGGTTIGFNHRLIDKPNQDCMLFAKGDGYVVGIVSDGCGSSPSSQFGATLAVNALGVALEQELQCGCIDDIPWRRLLQSLQVRISNVVGSMCHSDGRTKIIMDFFLFTIVGVVLTDDEAVFFSIGDGTIFINGKHISLDPQGTNTPNYLGYNLLDGVGPEERQEFQIVHRMPLTELEHFVVASDGIDDVAKRANDKLPGMDELCGGPEQFWTNDKFFRGGFETVRMSRRLGMMSKPSRDGKFGGLLKDDTTLIVGRRKPTS